MAFREGGMKLVVVLSMALGMSFALGCSCSTTTPATGDAGPRVDGAPSEDGGNDLDAADDGAIAVDAGSDATVDDASHPDTGPRPDAGMCVDLPPDPTRPVAIQCSLCRPPGPGGGTGACMTDADCTAGDNGRCSFGRGGAFCDYDLCFGDEDCNADEVCLCDGSNSGGNTCVSAECHVDADCDGGFACSPTFGTCGHYSGFVAYRCHRATDACTTDADCAAGYCAFDETAGHWQCSTSECAG
jgi:hypothetical protein